MSPERKPPNHLPETFFAPITFDHSGRIVQPEPFVSPFSNRTIKCWKHMGEIIIFDQKNENYQAKMNFRRDTVEVLIKTRGWNNRSEQHHPDLFATYLLLREFEYLVTNAGSVPSYFQAHWKSTEKGMTENYKVFLEELRRLEIRLEDLEHMTPDDVIFPQVVSAIDKTWTGKFVKKIGYTNVTRVGVNHNKGSGAYGPYGAEPPSTHIYVGFDRSKR